MKNIWIALAALPLTALTCTAAQATIFTLDIQYWDGVGPPPTDDTDPSDFAHFIVDDAFGGGIGNRNGPSGIWTYGNQGSYFGLPFQNVFIDIYDGDNGGGFTFTPYVIDDIGNDPDFNWVLDVQGPTALAAGGRDGFHILPGIYDTDDGYGDYFRVTIAQAGVDAAPEPATWAMMIGGFGLAGMALRRRGALDLAA